MFSAVITLVLLCLSYEADTVTFDPTLPIITHSGMQVEMRCRHDDGNLNVMLWYQQTRSGGMSLIGYGYTGSEPILEKEFESQFKMSREDVRRGALTLLSATQSDSAVYFCAASRTAQYEAYFGPGTRLTVLEQGRTITPPAKVQLLKPPECGKKNRTVVCVASGFYPDHVSVAWNIDGVNVADNVSTDAAATRAGEFYRISSRLTVHHHKWFSKSIFTCAVSFFDGTRTTYVSESITGEGKEISSGTELSRDKYLWITQSAKLSYIVFIAKSCVYGAFIWVVAWKLQSSREKRGK